MKWLLRFIPCHRKYGQSEFRKAVVYSTVFNSTFPSCVAYLIPATKEAYRARTCVYRENASDAWDIPWYSTRKRCITSKHGGKNGGIPDRNRMRYILCHNSDIRLFVNPQCLAPMSAIWPEFIRLNSTSAIKQQ